MEYLPHRSPQESFVFFVDEPTSAPVLHQSVRARKQSIEIHFLESNFISRIGIEMSMFPEEFSQLAQDQPSVSAWSVEINLKNVLVVESLTSFAPRAGGDLLRTLCLRSVSGIPDAFGDSLSESCPNLEYLELIKAGIQHLALSCPNLSVLNLEASVVRVRSLPSAKFFLTPLSKQPDWRLGIGTAKAPVSRTF
jgi:hypothetical protein